MGVSSLCHHDCFCSYIVQLSFFIIYLDVCSYLFLKIQAESSEDLYEWKTALEQALAQAPSAALVMGHNGIFRNDTTDTIEGSFQQCLCFSTTLLHLWLSDYMSNLIQG